MNNFLWKKKSIPTCFWEWFVLNTSLAALSRFDLSNFSFLLTQQTFRSCDKNITCSFRKPGSKLNVWRNNRAFEFARKGTSVPVFYRDWAGHSPPSLNKINSKIKWKKFFGGKWGDVLRLTQLKKWYAKRYF